MVFTAGRRRTRRTTQKDAENSNSLLEAHHEFRVGHAVAAARRLEKFETAFTGKTLRKKQESVTSSNLEFVRTIFESPFAVSASFCVPLRVLRLLAEHSWG